MERWNRPIFCIVRSNQAVDTTARLTLRGDDVVFHAGSALSPW